MHVFDNPSKFCKLTLPSLLPSFCCSRTFSKARLYSRMCDAKSSTSLVVKYGTKSTCLDLK